MDTQGIFDSSSTVRDCSTIFALSTLLSSVQIYNLKENVKEDDLQHLQLFTEYGKQLKKDNGKKPFQVLEFVIRDWQYDYDYAYGQSGGEELLAKRLEITEGMATELRELRQHIRSCFERVTCFLMPHPGFEVRKKSFAGEISKLDEEFKTALKELVPSILAPANLTPKLINGGRVTARDLFTYFKTYMTIFNSNTMPPIESIMKATSEAALLAAMQVARELYETRMARVTAGLSLPRPALQQEHVAALQAARAACIDKNKMASTKDVNESLARLTQELEALLPQYLLINDGNLQKALGEAKDAYEASVRRVHGADLLCVHPSDLQTIHNEAVAAALRVFDARRKQYPGIPDDNRTKLLESFLPRLDELNTLNNEHNRLFVADAKLSFMGEVERLLARDPPLGPYEFRNEYNRAKNRAVAAFKRRRNMPSTYYADVYEDDLLRSIENRYYIIREINRNT
ncbi:hypothetical protein O3G_MSEX004720 [Manduca sexta]|uniref:GB1/RHD3-type G domain-containing protein n=2 Tax=Manduca sexta TaxID=7130 RepID=A0A922CHH5_MANSE|nr:hypothetical protein O3G_MSEX004720 [Manduca sexta]